MGLGEVNDVDIVAQTCSVGGIVVIAENRQTFAQTCSCLGDEREQVVGYTAGKLADESRRMCADGVEVAQGNAIHAFVGGAAVAENVLGNLLGVAVGRCSRLTGSLLCYGQHFGVAIYCCRRREEDIGAAELFHELEDVHIRYQIVLIVFEGFAHRFTHSLVCGEVDNGAELVAFENTAESFLVAGVTFFESNLAAEDFLNAFYSRRLRV